MPGQGRHGAVFKARTSSTGKWQKCICRDDGTRRANGSTAGSSRRHSPPREHLSVFDVGEFAGMPYLTMAFTQGGSWQARAP